MRLKFVAIRHAKPIDEAVSDDQKILSEEGKSNQKKIALKLKSEKIYPDIIYTSPILRAVQSAEIVAKELPVAVEKIPALGNHFNEKMLFDILKDSSEGTTVFFVGHAPVLSDFVNKLVGKNVLPEGLPKSGAAVVSFDETVEYGTGKLVKLHTV